MSENELYRIKLPPLSGATDYAYLKNNNLGWASDDQRYFEFGSEADHDKFQAYLDICCGNRVELVAPDFKDVRVMGEKRCRY